MTLVILKEKKSVLQEFGVMDITCIISIVSMMMYS